MSSHHPIPSQDSPERDYYLPPQNTGLAEGWQKSGDQARYSELCQRGHDMVANAIIEGRRSGHMPSVRELYQIAAQVRRAIAWTNMKADAADGKTDTKYQYGMPFVRYEQTADCRLVDDLWNVSGSRYQKFFPEVQARLQQMQKMEAQDFKQGFGGEYSMELLRGRTQNQPSPTLHISREGCSVAKLCQESDDLICFSHAMVRDQDTFFAKADAHLQRVAQAEPPLGEKEFWQEMGAIGLELYHCAPLRLGSQTSTLMVLAGITKAMGYEVQPRRLQTDHFIEAELTPYKQFVDEYGGHFLQPPRHGAPPTEPFVVDTQFIADAHALMRKHFGTIDPVARLRQYLAAASGKPHVSFEINGFTVTEDGRITDIAMIPSENAAYVQRALDFIGTEVSQVLDLAPGQYVHPLARHRPLPASSTRFRQ